jgi:hypothetical protein
VEFPLRWSQLRREKTKDEKKNVEKREVSETQEPAAACSRSAQRLRGGTEGRQNVQGIYMVDAIKDNINIEIKQLGS